MLANVVGDALAGQVDQQDLHQSLLPKATTQHYEPHKVPADLKMAQGHGKAKKVYKPRVLKHTEEEKHSLCPCCDLPLEGEKIPLCTALPGIYHLGSGYALYFRFLKFAIVLLLLTFITGGVYNFLTNMKGGGCVDTANIDYCIEDFITKYAIANKRNKPDQLQLQLWFNLGAILVIIVFFHYIRYELRRTEIEVDDKTVTPADYAVRVSGVPETVQDPELKEWIEKFGTAEKPIKVRKITRSYNLCEYVQYTAAIDDLANRDCKSQDQDEKLILREELKENYLKLKALKTEKLKYTPESFVTFETAYQANQIVEILKKNRKAHRKSSVFSFLYPNKANMLEGSLIKMARAPEPSDILWINLGFKTEVKRLRRVLTHILTGLMVILSFTMIVSVSFVQRWLIVKGKNSHGTLFGEKSILVQIIAYCSSLLIMVVNFYLGSSLRKLADYEKHGTYTSFFRGIAEKLSIAQLVNTAFTTLVAKTVVTLYFDEGDYELSDFPLYNKGGVVESMFYVFISNAYCTPILNIFDPFYYMKLWSRRTAIRDSNDTSLNQKSAHTLFEGTQYDMSYKYAMLLKTILLTCFFAPALPIVPLISVAGLCAMYWVDKYLLLRRAALPYALGSDLTNSMIEYLEWAGFMYAAGNAFFYYTLESSTGAAFGHAPIIVWAGIVISLINIVLPMGYLNSKIFKIEDEITEEETYDQVRLNFLTDYDIENPVTRKKGLAELREAWEAKNNELMIQNIKDKNYGELIIRKFDPTQKKDLRRGASFARIIDGLVGSDDPADINLGPLNFIFEEASSPILKKLIPQPQDNKQNAPSPFKFMNAAASPFATLFGMRPAENPSQPDNDQSTSNNAYQPPQQSHQPPQQVPQQVPQQPPQNPGFPAFNPFAGLNTVQQGLGNAPFNQIAAMTQNVFNTSQQVLGNIPFNPFGGMANTNQRVTDNYPVFGNITNQFSLFGSNNQSVDEESGPNNNFKDI